jgi:DNA-binding GntR family transcriptional regulator
VQVTTVSRDSALALHEQIRRAILTDIWKGLYRPGDLLPSEKELSVHFGVNRLTVRQAVHALANQGHVRPMQGRGYQVRSATLSADVLTVISTSHYLQELGLETKTRTLGTTIVPAQAEVAEALGLRRGADTIKIVRQRFAQDVLIALDEVYYDADKFPDLLEADLDHYSLTETLFRKFDLRIGRVSTTLQAGVAGRRAELLDSSPDSPILIASTLMFDLEESPVELGVNYYHSERIKLTINAPVDPSSWPYGAP